MKAVLTSEFVAKHCEHIPYSALVVYAILCEHPKQTLKALSAQWGIPYPTVRYSSMLLQQAGLLKSKGGNFDGEGFVIIKNSKFARRGKVDADIERAMYTAIVDVITLTEKYKDVTYIYTKFSITLMRRLISRGIDTADKATQYAQWFIKHKKDKSFTFLFLCCDEMVSEYLRGTHKKVVVKASSAGKFERMQQKYQRS